MKTIILIIESGSATKSIFGAALSKKTGVALFDLSQYRAKYRTLPSGTGYPKAAEELLSDISKHEIAILDNSFALDALNISRAFNKKIVYLPDSRENVLTYGWIGEIFPKLGCRTWKSHTECPQNIKNKAELIKNMNPDFIFLDNVGAAEHFIWRIGQIIKQK